ncbi:MAG: hypothetical protein AB2392_16550 [Neobacillus sp.]
MSQPVMKTKVQYPDGELLFTYHKQSGYIGFICAMIFVAILESVGVSFLLYKWSPVLHWIHLLFCVLLIVFLIVDLKAVIRNPIKYRNNELSMKIGIRPRIVIDSENIREIRSGNLHYQDDRKKKEVLDLSLLGFDDPTFEIVLIKPIVSTNLFGTSNSITRIFLTVDEKDMFLNLISKRVS